VAYLLLARAGFRDPAKCPSLPCRRRGSGDVRRSDFNPDLSAAGACSSRSRELACSSTPPANAEREFNLAPQAAARTFSAEPILRPRRRAIPFLQADLLRSDEFVPLKLEWESLDDQPLLEK